MLDVDLAALYGVETRVLLQAVRRNNTRFPADFMFQLTDQECCELEVTICDLKFRAWLRRSTLFAVGIHGTRRRDAFERDTE
jgi:hypothetical protein